MPSIAIKHPIEILDYIKEDTYAVAIYEVQFFEETIVEVVEHLADKGIRVIVAGLDKDFRGEPFGTMPALLTKAEFVTKLTSICSVCGASATRSQRLIMDNLLHILIQLFKSELKKHMNHVAVTVMR